MLLIEGVDPQFMDNPVIIKIALVCAFIIALKGVIVVLTEFFRMIPPLITSIKDCWKAIKNGHFKKRKDDDQCDSQ